MFRQVSMDCCSFQMSPHTLVKVALNVCQQDMSCLQSLNNSHPTVSDTSPNTPLLSMGVSTRAQCHSLVSGSNNRWWTMINLSSKVRTIPGFKLGWISGLPVVLTSYFLGLQRITKPSIIAGSFQPLPLYAPRPPPFTHTKGKICLPQKHLFVIIPAAFGAWLGDPLTSLNVRAQRWDRGPRTTSWVWTNWMGSCHCHSTDVPQLRMPGSFEEAEQQFVTHLFSQQLDLDQPGWMR